MEEVVKVELIENETSARQSGCNFEVLSSIEELNSYIKAQEEATLSKFIVYNKDKTFGNDHYRPGPGQPIGHISWLGDNVPHIRIGRKRYGCHQGRDKQVKAKERYKEQKRKAEEEGQAVTKKRRLYQDSKKLSCPFQFTAIQILKFPEFEVEHGSSPYLKQKTAAVIKSAIKEGEPIEMVMEYHVIIPPKEEHRNHPIEGPIAHLRERVAEEVIDKITELARQGVKKVSEMKPHLERYVENDLGVRDETKTRRRFYPTNKDFQNIMQRAKKRPNQSVVDKESLQELIERWQAESPGDCIYFRPWSPTQSLLLCYQTVEQKRLLKLYGNHLCLLDATYRTCSYAQPLYFLCVRANVGYFVVAVFIAQHEASTAIQEALEIIKEWNPNWRPGCFLADFNNEDIMALETVFPDTCVLLSDFHREKAWSEWLCSEGNEVSHIGVAIKNMLNRIAQASTVSLYHEALNTFQSSAIWRDSQEIKDWFSNTWLPNVQRWATAFRSSTHTLLIRMNNGIERQNELLKSSFLDGYKNCSLSNLMTVIVTDFLPKSYKRYVELNRRRSFKYTNSDGELPTFLHELPLDVAQHVMKRWYGNLSSESIHQGSNKSMFLVASEMGSSLHYEVHLGNDVMPPSCTCIDWGRYMLPCTHICALLQTEICSWESLSPVFTNNPILKIDPECVSNMQNMVKMENTDYGDSVCKIFINEIDREPFSTQEKKNRTLKKSCVEKLRLLTRYVNALHDDEYLEELNEELDDMVRTIRAGVQIITDQ
ncbi:uncharacterized protein [Penaeus vannamei]|uniref:uncharacterized protein n=1 Tax=Penaeus vannamei TaxID=6689 RepID=UPI000F665B62|nr:uncharacterized protein LOC113827370 [Penaeus vannamei]